MDKVKRIARSAEYNDEKGVFEIHYWDGGYEEKTYGQAQRDQIIVADGKTGEEMLTEKMAEGWNISIECKGKGREYEMTYEAVAHKVAPSLEEHIKNYMNMKHAVGDTLWELMYNMFYKEHGGKDENSEKNS